MFHGLTPPDVRACRVLEIGCGRGGNLLPLAEQLPNSHLVGIDLSYVQIEEAQTWRSKLGFSNIDFRMMDVMDVDTSLGMFDYIICHGVFSWVPHVVQQAILRICQQNLVPNGIAYVSYNTKPGWNYRGSLRDAMLYRASQFSHPSERIAEVKKLLEVLANELKGEELHEKLLLKEIEAIKGRHDSYIFHEYLEENNSPCYFHDFAGRLPSLGLQYLGEADLSLPFRKSSVHSSAEAFESLSTNYLQLEQYSDFVTGRMFRQSLICHDSQLISRNCDPNILQQFRLESLLEPCMPSDIQAGVGYESTSLKSSFRYKHTGKVVQLELDSLMIDAAFRILGDVGNGGCSFSWLFTEAFNQLVATGHMSESDLNHLQFAQESRSLQTALVRLFLSGGLWLHTVLPSHALSVSAQPKASLIARDLSAAGERITTLQHRSIELDPLDRLLLCKLDGTNSIPQLVLFLKDAIAGQRDSNPSRTVDELELLKMRLTHFVRNALLIE
jgi:SAM-dependent methyltransferase